MAARVVGEPGRPQILRAYQARRHEELRAKIDKARDKWRKNDGADEAKKKIAEQEADFTTIAKWLAEQSKSKSHRDAALETKGKDLFTDTCATCHSLQGEGGKTGPELTDYGSANWIRGMVMDPASPERYKNNNAMTAFRNSAGPGADVLLKEFRELHEKNDPKINISELSDIDRELIIRWLTGDDRVVFGGKSIAP